MKDTEVRTMFETIAGGYDLQNSVLSLRRDIHWRKVLAGIIPVMDQGRVLDVAIGTAEVALEICRQHGTALVFGVDFSPAMLKVGQHKINARRLSDRIMVMAGDGRSLPVRSSSIDVVTIAFGIRNIEERLMALQEFYRVIKPGGKLFIMEFSYPDGPLLGKLYRFYFEYILPPLGNLLSRTDYAYSYLAASVEDFPIDSLFMQEIKDAGFTQLDVKKLTFGIAKIFCGTKAQP
ncbi:MAG: bifunctional demethylmenaquinone methyltransferase/2-methoxy-6-polyprenyl-1,4-benzoquinol methylase UbiE [Desulfobulbales bacterium]